MGRKITKYLLGLAAVGLLATGCQSSSEETVAPVEAEVEPLPKILYVASGACYSGNGITTYTGAQSSRAVTKYRVDTGASEGVFTDLNIGSNVSVATVPQDMIDNGDSILMLTENPTTMSDRKIFKLDKRNPATYVTYANDPTALTATAAHITRRMARGVDGTIYFTKSVAVERLNTLGVRIAKNGNTPYINPAAATGNCATAAATQITDIELMTPFTNTFQGKQIFIHAGATAVTNRISIVARTGLTSATAGDCLASSPAGGASTQAHTNAANLSGPTTFVATGASLTSSVYIPTPAPATTTGKLVVSYSGSTNTAFDNNTNFNYGIVIYDVTETSDTAVTLTNPVIIWRDHTIVWAPSAMAFDPADNSLYVAVGGSPGLINQTTQNFGYNIEKFTLDYSATPSLTRVSTNNQPFITGNAYTKCISSLLVAEPVE